MYSIKTQISFEAAHRLYDVATYSRECSDNLHGHSYKVNVIISCTKLNDASMVADFKAIKQILKKVIEDKYDHSCIIRECDPLKDAIVANCDKVHVVEGNPTAEWMAKLFADQIEAGIAFCPELTVEQVEVQETEHNIAIWTRED